MLPSENEIIFCMTCAIVIRISPQILLKSELFQSPITPEKLSNSLYTITTDFSTIKNGAPQFAERLAFFEKAFFY